MICHKNTLKHFVACSLGYYGPSCDLPCLPGAFGENCSGDCFPVCSEQECDPIYGCKKSTLIGDQTTALGIYKML